MKQPDISSLMSEERFAALMPAYENEQAGLKEKVQEIEIYYKFAGLITLEQAA